MKLTKTAALKGALLMVLAANVSWEQVDFSSIELASETVGGKTTTAATTSTTAAPAKTEVVAAKPEVAKPEPKALKPVEQKPAQPSFDSEAKICGETYKVHYQQIEKDGKSLTEMSARKASSSSDEWDVAVVLRSDLIATIAEKESAVRILTSNVKEYRSKRKESCATDVAAEKKDSDKKEEKGKKAEQKAERDQDIADGVKNCTMDRKGNRIDKADRLECLTEALETVDKRVDKKGSDGKRLSEEALTRAISAEMQRLHKEIKRLAKSELMSKDESRAEDAKEMLTRAMDAISETADVYDLGKSKSGRQNNSISKLIGELSALKHAGDTHREGERYAERAKEVRDTMRDSYSRALAEPLNPWARQEYDRAKYDYDQLRWDIGMNYENDFMRTLQRFQSTGMISSGDYKDFTQPYTDVQKFLREALGGGATAQNSNRTGFSGKITGSVLGSDYQVPTNLASMRLSNGTVQSAFTNGSALPTAIPVLNLPTLPTTATHAPTSIFQAPRL